MRFWRKRTSLAPATLAALDPYWVHDRFERFVAATLPEGRERPAGIWDAKSGKLVWAPGPAWDRVVLSPAFGRTHRITF